MLIFGGGPDEDNDDEEEEDGGPSKDAADRIELTQEFDSSTTYKKISTFARSSS